VRDHRALYARPSSWAEVGLVYPRQAVWNQHPEAVDAFRRIGQALVDEHFLFDVIWDQKMTAQRLARYGVVIAPGAQWLSKEQHALLAGVERKGIAVLRMDDAQAVLDSLGKRALSRVEAPWTLRAAAYSVGSRRVLHLVNYNRDEQAGAKKKGPEGECPIPVENIAVDLRLKGKPRAVRLLSPDQTAPEEVEWTHEKGRLQFRVPRVEVYTLVEIVAGA